MCLLFHRTPLHSVTTRPSVCVPYNPCSLTLHFYHTPLSILAPPLALPLSVFIPFWASLCLGLISRPASSHLPSQLFLLRPLPSPPPVSALLCFFYLFAPPSNFYSLSMDLSWLLWGCLLLVIPILLLEMNSTLKFYFKITFYCVHCLVLSALAVPVCLIRNGGRNVDNMRVIRAFVRSMKYAYGLRYEVKGLENLQVDGPCVIISNHQSILDMMGLMEILPDRCVQIAKKALIFAGSVGLITYLGGVIYINKKRTTDAKKVMEEVGEVMMKDNLKVWVYPEGTRNISDDLLPFKKGAFHLAVKAQILCLAGVIVGLNGLHLGESNGIMLRIKNAMSVPTINGRPMMRSNDVRKQLDTDAKKPARPTTWIHGRRRTRQVQVQTTSMPAMQEASLGRRKYSPMITQTENMWTYLAQQVPIIQVVYSSYCNFYNPAKRLFTSGVIKVEVFPKIETTGLTADDVTELTGQCYDTMRTTFFRLSNKMNQANGPCLCPE
ncbi:1-acyl-sn-glycerol-3-phosphate acyltransferase beta isoform X1 [Ambystoma mexicanum]|uniref:1-acyl-sn-glycerol-3-phosphate acyltransferase beta isoform X1 n=1 Tax=Ambystoma mexicanum TaxID=8296 RepID=UPI0037E9B1FA